MVFVEIHEFRSKIIDFGVENWIFLQKLNFWDEKNTIFGLEIEFLAGQEKQFQ